MAQARLATLVPVRNMNRAVKFYTKTLGGRVAYRGEGQMRNMFASLVLGKDEVWLITPDKREKRTLAYTSFVVKNIKSFVRGLQRKGVRFQRAQRVGPETKVDGPIAYESFGASAFFKDTEGNLMMVWQGGSSM
jgi:catechol 2,3-dioxygenase-like lactoylglutathione lyase family enzyme